MPVERERGEDLVFNPKEGRMRREETRRGIENQNRLLGGKLPILGEKNFLQYFLLPLVSNVEHRHTQWRRWPERREGKRGVPMVEMKMRRMGRRVSGGGRRKRRRGGCPGGRSPKQ
jgi:hypothetical protein